MFKVGDEVVKTGSKDGYDGPGIVVAVFKNWMGQVRYVVGHKIDGGRGLFYHIYSVRDIVSLKSQEENNGVH
jgi:hypothetical protein